MAVGAQGVDQGAAFDAAAFEVVDGAVGGAVVSGGPEDFHDDVVSLEGAACVFEGVEDGCGFEGGGHGGDPFGAVGRCFYLQLLELFY
ncbi:hypothetical protein GCM10010289_54890 [Streptomyces violascens]|uniref:Uncharacterized protein n=1 Tax=Streptomyces violascens TaxID=67381 RepID=A0ABQ3QVB9_9ACTN|nr:hypothetical protein GCM10010289_54890 [Streptomyces violascens]GHI41226.1 hypothetical protein Sviol_56340 [Streptomyces violascens]